MEEIKHDLEFAKNINRINQFIYFFCKNIRELNDDEMKLLN